MVIFSRNPWERRTLRRCHLGHLPGLDGHLLGRVRGGEGREKMTREREKVTKGHLQKNVYIYYIF
jgi:hypothetical protein